MVNRLLTVITFSIFLFIITACGDSAKLVDNYEMQDNPYPDEDVRLVPEFTPYGRVPPESIQTPMPAQTSPSTPSPTSRPENIIAGTNNFTADGVQLTVVNSPTYADIGIQGNYVRVLTNEQTGLFCASTMTEIVPPLSGWVRQNEDGLSHILVEGNRWGVADADGNVIVPFISDVSFSMNYGRGVVRQNDKWGAIDFAGNIYVPLEFDNAGRFFSEGLLNVARSDGEALKWGFVDIYGQEIIPFIYEEANPFAHGFARVMYDGKMGLINMAGEVIIPFKYIDVMPLLCGTAVFSVGEDWRERKIGIVDLSDGRLIVPPIYSMGPSSDFQCEYFSRQFFFDGLAALERDRKWGYVNMQGEEVIPFIYEFASDFHNGLSIVGNGNEMAIINTYGEMVIPFGEYHYINFLSDGLASVLVDSGRTDSRGFRELTYGVIEIATGSEIVPPIYSEIIQRDDGFAAQYGGRKDGRWGLLDEIGREIIPPMYTYLGVFMDGFALASVGGERMLYSTGELTSYMLPVGGQWLLIDRENNVAATFEFAAMQRVSNNLLAFSEYISYSVNPHMPEDRRVQSGEWGFIQIG